MSVVTQDGLHAGPGLLRDAQSRQGSIAIDERHVDACERDRLLVDRCVSGDVIAWEDLYSQCHSSLLASVRCMLRGASDDANLIEEIAAAVWFSIIADDGERLDRYDPRRGARLVTYLRGVARDEIKGFFRSEGRRRSRELVAFERTRRRDPEMETSPLEWQEFLRVLTPAEREYCTVVLLNDPAAASDAERARTDKEYSRSNVWQLKHRIRVKIEEFFGCGKN